MARWKASNEEGLNLIENLFSCIRMTRELGIEWRHSRASAKPKCLIQNGSKAHEILLQLQTQAIVGQEIRNVDILSLTSFLFTSGWCE